MGKNSALRKHELERNGQGVFLEGLIEEWSPRLHCSNCLQCKVRGNALGEVIAFCDRGYGEPKLLVQLIRPKYAQGFRRAIECPDFESMDEKC